jgi:YVTN family beta-propeller protein
MAMRTLSRFLVGLVIPVFLSCAVQAAPFAYIPNAYSDNVSVIDTATNTIVATVRVGSYPVGVAVNAAGTRVYIVNVDDASVSVIDAMTNTVIATVPVPPNPSGIAVHPTGNWVYVGSVKGNTVSVISAATNTVVATVPLGSSAMGVAVDPAGARVYVSGPYANGVWVIDTATNTVIAMVPAVPFAGGIAVNSDGTLLYVTNIDANSFSVIDVRTSSVIAVVPVGAAPVGIAINGTGTRIYVTNADANTVSVIDAVARSVVTTIPVGAYPVGVAVNPADTRVYVANADSNTVSVIDSGTDAIIATVRVGGSPIAFGQFIGPAALAPPTTPDLNQHGLTGSWYEPVTSGQGVELEVYPDLSAPGTGLAFMSWFTYDSVVGGAERQRWYTAEGPVVTGRPNATLTIYRNTGGNFNAPPITTATAVGTATLSFDSCTTGLLSYNFTDGTGRTGSIPLSRLTQSMTCSTTSARPTNADFALSGNWYDPATSGQGITVEVNPGSKALFLAWYTYAPNGAGAGPPGQRWYTAEQTTALMPGARTIPVQFFETTGGSFDIPTTPAPNTVVVGSGTMAFQSCSSATLSYNFTGGSSSGASGTIALKRVGPVPAGCAI